MKRSITRCSLLALFLSIILFNPAARAAETLWLDAMDLSTMKQGWGTPQKSKSVTGRPLSIAGTKFERGVGSHAPGQFKLQLPGGQTRFIASVGVDDDTTGPGTVVFQVLADGKPVFDSGVMRTNMPAKEVNVDLAGVKTVSLKITDGGDNGMFDHADWANARFEYSGAAPVVYVPTHEPPYLLTPKPLSKPRINGPVVYGARPGHPFLYRIPAQGLRPITFSAQGLPKGLELDKNTGIIRGTTPAKGDYRIVISAKNQHGTDNRELKLVAGDRLALTPPMGWNHWYAHYDRITDKMMREAADIMVGTGMADVGYEYVNIDDCWMNADKNKDARRNGPFRDAQGNLIPNTYFPDMKGLADYIHAKGLKAGLYTSPGKKTCAGFAGALNHEAQDAKQFAQWGFDFLKYDWCSYGAEVSKPPTLEQMKAPYVLMGNLLKEQNRDMLFNLCQYGMGEVWKWGGEVGGHSWRTSGDLGYELDRIFDVAIKNSEHRQYQKPGEWNDPDYIQIGYIGNARGGGLPAPCPLSPTEQYSFMSLWALMASPLFYSGDMSKLDEFTLNVLCNPEVIEVDQDPLGECARVIQLTPETFLMIKNMADGSKALGLANRGESQARISANWAKLGLPAKQRVRDVWRQADLGEFNQSFESDVRPTGVTLLRVWPVK